MNNKMAVYTPLSFTEIQHILLCYEIGELLKSAPVETGYDNSHFCLQTTKGNYILTLIENNLVNVDIIFHCQWVDFLYQKGYPSPRLITPQNDNHPYMRKDDISSPAILLFEHKKGSAVDITSLRDLTKSGEALAHLHLTAREFPLKRQDPFSDQLIDEILKKSLDQLNKENETCDKLIAFYPDIVKKCCQMIEAQQIVREKEINHSLPHGICHLDYFPDNILMAENEINAVIDYYFSAYAPFIYDIAIAINAFCFEKIQKKDNVINKERMACFLNGYEKIRPLEKQEKEFLPLFQQKAAYRFASTRLYDWLHKKHPFVGEKRDAYDYIALYHHFIGHKEEY